MNSKPPQNMRLLLFAGCACLLADAAPASVFFTYDDHSGTPDSGTYAVGQTITFDIWISFSNPPPDAAGISYWFETGVLSSGYFSLTALNIGTSPFSDLGPNISTPEPLDPQTDTDLGALSPSNLSPNTYFVATASFLVNPGALPGNYVIQNTTTGGKTSILVDSGAVPYAIPQAQYHVQIVPEPRGGGLLLLSALPFLFVLWRKGRVCR